MAVSGILFDTNAYAAFKQGEAEAREIVRGASAIGLCSIVLGELLAGFALGKREDQNRLELQQFLASNRVHVLAIDRDTPTSYAIIYRALREKGRPIPTNDMWIAACAMQHGYSLFTYDAHFQAITGIHTGTTLAELI